MLKIKALNQESSSDEDVPTIRREAQEEIVLELYNNALRAQAKKEYTDSETILKQLIEENIPQLENNGGLPKSMSTLKYSCYVNLGNIYLNQDNIIKALESFSKASELDSTDVTLWAKIGKLALKEDKFNKAAHAFSKGLECSESHWPCLDNLISVLYVIKDTISCLVYIGKALVLDADYIKGLVLRKQIYKDNPATREYYKLYNPDHIWEPPLDIEVDQEEEEEILKEAQSLCDRLTEVEKALAPKPFDTIPLPKALGDYTWVSLAKTVICCHKYITDNRMSHFTFFDMSKCMSQSIDFAEPIQSSKLCEDVNIAKDTKPSDVKIAENVTDVSSSAEKMDTGALLVERRASQNSETTNGNDNAENTTPIQTDNDDEQNMELDNDETDGDNQGDNTDNTSQRRRGKRKRDVLSDLQIWGWHSKRKQPKKSNKDFTVQDALNRIIPKSLLKNKITAEIINQGDDDSMNTMDIYNMYVENKELNFLSPIHSPKSVNFEAYFGTDREKDDVLGFWSKERPRVDAIVLVKELTFELAKLWQYKWPKELVSLFIEVFKMFREHCDQPQVFCTELSFDEIKSDALATLLYGELFSFSSETTEGLHPAILSYLQIVSGWSESWEEEFSSFFIRFYWLQSHCFRKTDENELAIRALEAILGEIDEKEKDLSERISLSLPNCFKYGFISKQIIDKILRHLNMIISLGSIENLFNSQKYTEVAEILKQTFHSGTYPKVGRMGRPAQLGILLHSLWFTNWEECFIWTEECLNEALQNYGKPNSDQEKWVKIMEKCLGIFQEIIKKETVSIIDRLAEDKRCRLVEGLSKIVCKQLNSESDACKGLGCITPWLLLHYILLREEHRQYANKRLSQSKKDKIDTPKENTPESTEEELPPSIAILCSAHEFLGPKGWCLAGNGELLHFILDTVLDRLDTPIFESFRDKIDIHIEQALFCLYLYPSKKNKISRHLVDHNVNPLPLTWERSFQLYQYYAPDSLPEFNSYKNASISSDLEQLFKRVIGLVPSICALHDHLPSIMDFIHGKTDKLPEAVEFPNRVRAIYYLLGDYYFKEKEFARCIKYFQLDLCINPTRLDSWASLGLSYAAQLENTLNYCEKFKNEADFFDKAKSAQICFKKALELDPENLVLWIECGSFEYMVHSFCSRLIKFESESFSMEKFELLESEKESYLDSSGNNLERAIALYEIDDANEQDERWLQYYILGKIAEKKRKEPAEYLQYYLTASTLLHENKATYPEKINYNNPQHMSVEALELHYRIHASVLKYLELHEGKEILNTLGSFFKKCLNSTAKHFATPPPPVPQIPKPAENSVSAATNLSFQDQFLNSIKNCNDIKDISEDVEDPREIVEKCLEDILTKVDEIAKEQDLKRTVLKENEVEKITEENINKDLVQEKDEDLDVTIIEENEVIMIISDSEDEGTKMVKEVAEPNASDSKETTKEIEMEVDHTEQVQDVQSLLDKMMEQTMKDTEKMDDSDANNSTEQIEEVVLKEDTLEIPNGELLKPNTDQIKPTDTKVAEVVEPSKPKSSDSETDTENKKAADDEDSSSSSSSSSSDSSSSDSDSDDSDSSSSSSSSDTSNENMSNSEILQLVDKCVNGLEICITRLPQNYKALYRLSHLFFNYKGRKDYTKCKQLLLGEYKCKDSTVITGLFSERKTTNFFNGIWRIPSTEIDRPGSLAAHMNRCISLLLQVLRNTNDTKTLMELCMQLRKVPDRDKIYIKDSDRKAFSEQALSMCIQSFKAQIKNVTNMQNQQIVKLLHDIFRIYQRVQKHIPLKESTFSGLLTDVYKQFIKENIPDNVNVLDLAIKFCQQHRPIEKHKMPVLNPSLAFSRNPGLATPPVHPAPSTFLGSHKPLKPPSLGRPRGRPPLPKIPGQIRQPRAKGPSNTGMGSYPWQNPMFAGTNFSYEYLKHYENELIKQYSQNLSIPQLNQLTQLFSTGQLNNPALAQANQFLTQTSLLNSTSSLLRPPVSSIGTGAIPTSSSSLLDSTAAFKGFNPQLSPALANLTPEQMKFLESMLPNMSKQTSGLKSSSSGTKSNGNQHAGAYKTYPSSSTSSKLTGNVTTAVTSSRSSNPDVQKLKPSTSGKLSAPVFKEPIITKALQSNSSEDKTANMLMKDRPNISITPVGGLCVTPVITASNLGSKSGYNSLVTSTALTTSKTISYSNPHTVPSNILKQMPSLPTSYSIATTSKTTSYSMPHTVTSNILKQHMPSLPTSHSIATTSKTASYSMPHTVTSNVLKQTPSLATSHSVSRSNYVPTIVSSSISRPKPTPLSIPHTSSNTTFSKPAALSISHTSPSTSRHAPAAHSSTSPKPTYNLPVTPPPVSSPSFIKPGMSTSPGKTLQEKLADKKKEQETKQLMKNIEAEIFAANIPSSSAALLKGFNLPNIPSSLSVSPSSTNNSINPYPMNVPLGMEKQQTIQRLPSSKNAGHTAGHSGEHKLPASLTVSKSLPSPAYTPRFPPDSGISISQVSPSTTKEKPKSAEKHSTSHKGGAFIPVSLDKSVDISPISLKDASNSPISSKEQIKRSSPHTVAPGFKMSNPSSPKSKPKPIIAVKRDIFKKHTGSTMEISKSSVKQPNPDTAAKHSFLKKDSFKKAKRPHLEPTTAKQEAVLKKDPSKQDSCKQSVVKSHSSEKSKSKHSSDREALSVIKTLSSIDISRIPSTSKTTNKSEYRAVVICLDSDDE